MVLFDDRQYDLLSDAAKQMMDYLKKFVPVLQDVSDLFRDIKLQMEEMLRYHQTFSFGSLPNKKVVEILNKVEAKIVLLENQQKEKLIVIDEYLEQYKNICSAYYAGND